MEEKIKAYVDRMLSDVPYSPQLSAIRDELIDHMTATYRQFRSEGCTEEVAYAMTLARSGDLSRVADELKASATASTREAPNTASASSDASPKRTPTPNHKESKKAKQNRKLFKQFSSFFWILVVAAYLLYSFLVPGAWAHSWIVFLIAPAVQSIVQLVLYFDNRKMAKKALGGAVWCGITALYFIVSFVTHRWDITWIMFIIGVAVHNALNAGLFHEWDVDDDHDEACDQDN